MLRNLHSTNDFFSDEISIGMFFAIENGEDYILISERGFTLIDNNREGDRRYRVSMFGHLTVTNGLLTGV